MCGGGSAYAETAEPDGAAAGTAVDSDDNPARAIDAPPDQWRRGGGISAATRGAISEVSAALEARPMTQGALATELAAFAFGGEQPRLPAEQRRLFPTSQTAVSAFLAGKRNLGGAACSVVEAWARARSAQAKA